MPADTSKFPLKSARVASVLVVLTLMSAIVVLPTNSWATVSARRPFRSLMVTNAHAPIATHAISVNDRTHKCAVARRATWVLRFFGNIENSTS